MNEFARQNQDNDKLENQIGEQFNKISDSFPDHVSPNDKRIQTISNLVGNVRGKNILDVGCGKGRFSKWLIANGALVTGIELSNNLLKEAQNISGGTFLEGSATHLNFEDETFDCVICIEVLEHIPDTQKAVSEMCRVLKKGGKILIIDRNKFSILRTIWKKYRELKNQWMYPRNFAFKERLFSPWNLSKLLSNYCTEVKINYLGEFIQKGDIIYTLATRISDGLSRIIPIMSYNIAWLGIKKE